jgi:uncharacterized protein YndB with AHSA1/START domain
MHEVVIQRTFEESPHLLWQMWTDPQHFKAWYGPQGTTIPVADMDLRVGGKRLLCMQFQTSDGPRQMWFTGQYLEIIENQRLVYTESISDEHGNVLSPTDMGMPEGHPTTTQVTVDLEDLGGHTRMTMTHAGIPADSPGASGWAMALDKLATYIEMQAV